MLADAQSVVTGEGRSSPFVVQTDPNDSGDVFDRERRMVQRSQVLGPFVHGCFFWAIVETNSVRSDTEREEENFTVGDEEVHTSGRSSLIAFSILVVDL